MSDGIVTALAAFQAELPRIGKGETASIPGKYAYRYADLSDVVAAIVPLLARHGIAYTAVLEDDGERFTLRSRLLHASGESIDSLWPVLPAAPQHMGSAITYGRRYCLLSLTGVHPTGEDDDGAATAGPEHKALAADTVDTGGRRAERSKGPQTPADDPWQTASPAKGGLTRNQWAILGRAFEELGMSSAHRLLRVRVLSKVVGREISSSQDLTPAEVPGVMESFAYWRRDENAVKVFRAITATDDPLAALELVFPAQIDDHAIAEALLAVAGFTAEPML